MAEVKWIKIPTNFFDNEIIKTLDDTTVLLYLHLLCSSYKKSRKGIFNIANIVLTDEVINNVFMIDNAGDRLKELEDVGLIFREETQIKVIKFWVDKHNRNSAEYKKWRMDVFMRDGFRCQSCGTKNDIQAHHIKHWKDNKNERYVVSNGVTLCRQCHLNAHGGRWK